MAGQQWAMVGLAAAFVFVWSLLGAIDRIVSRKPWAGLGLLASVTAVLTMFGLLAVV